MAPIDGEDHVRGPERAPVSVVLYGHYQNADCARLSPLLQELVQRRTPILRFAYRHFPLPASHLYPCAMMAAETAEAAAVRGRFWQMHDWLFKAYRQLDANVLLSGVELFGFPVEAVELELSYHRFLGRIRRDTDSGVRCGVTRAPALFVNGSRLNSQEFLDLVPAIDLAISRALAPGRGSAS
jgi:hypothetical protein